MLIDTKSLQSHDQHSHPMVFNAVETHTLKQFPSNPWNNIVYTTQYIVVKLNYKF
jgi:hypothetical protein